MAFEISRVISKTNFMVGLRCPVELWNKMNRTANFPPLNASTRAILNEGNRVGELARQLYPTGILLKRDSDPQIMHDTSKEALRLGVPLFESGMLDETAQLYALPDILVPVEGGMWDLIEVKSSTKVKPYHPKDVAFQKTVYESAGLRIRDTYLMHVNPDYVKNGEIDLEQYFVMENINDEVSKYQPHIRKWVSTMIHTISLPQAPGIVSGQVCKDCSLEHQCFGHLPEFNVFKLTRGRSVAYDLMRSDILEIAQIPDDYHLKNFKHEIQRQSVISEQPYVDREKIAKFLAKILFPIYLLDFETIAPAVPIYDISRPYEDIPFQYSLHIFKSLDSEPVHQTFIARGDEDPRERILGLLKRELGNSGSIIAYNSKFEAKCLKNMARAYPGSKEWVEAINLRLVDLMKPFEDFSYYHYMQNGKYSMKKVLPLFSDVTHSGLEIAEGMGARVAYMRAIFDPTCTEEERQQIFRSLEKYCGLDTYGMIYIIRGLYGLI